MEKNGLGVWESFFCELNCFEYKVWKKTLWIGAKEHYGQMGLETIGFLKLRLTQGWEDLPKWGYE